MAQFRDVLPSQQSWIHDLIKAEAHPDAERVLQLGRSFDPQQLVEESAVEFLTALREHFGEFARAFNAFAESGQKFQEVKIYNTAQTAADFMLFRNQIKLMVSSPVHGVIQLAFAQHQRGAISVDGIQSASSNPGPAPGDSQTQDLVAQVGPFREVSWMFQGEKVSVEQVAKFYFAEFIRTTRDVRQSRSSNQQLIQQIRSLLEERGLDVKL